MLSQRKTKRKWIGLAAVLLAGALSGCQSTAPSTSTDQTASCLTDTSQKKSAESSQAKSSASSDHSSDQSKESSESKTSKETEVSKEAAEPASTAKLDQLEDPLEFDDSFVPELTTYSITGDLGYLDRAPVSLNGQAWLIQRNGLFSYIAADGSQISDSQEPTAQVRTNRTKADMSVFACIAGENDMFNAAGYNLFPYDPDSPSYCQFMTGAASPYTFIKNGDGISLLDRDGITEMSDEFNIEKLPFMVREDADVYDGPYWINNPKMKKITGPYDDSINPGSLFSHSDPMADLIFFANPISGVNNTPVGNPFWSLEDSGYALYSKDGSKAKSGFDYVELIDSTSIAGWNGNVLTVFDENLNPVYSGMFEQGGNAIGSIAPVKLGGTWKLITIE